MWISLLLFLVLAGFAVLVAGSSILAVVLIVLGLALLGLGLWLRAMRRRCARWLPSAGTVLESRIDRSDSESERPIVRYRYAVGGEVFEGHRIAYAGHGVSLAAMEALIAPYVEGEAVTVYYDPTWPARAVLDRNVQADWYWWAGVGVFFIVLALALPFLA